MESKQRASCPRHQSKTKLLAFAVVIRNRGEQSLTVSPEQFRIVRPGKKPETLSPLTAKGIADRLQPGFWERFGAAWADSDNTTTTKSTSIVRDEYGIAGTIESESVFKPKSEDRATANLLEHYRVLQHERIANMLLTNTVAPGGTLSAVVFFKDFKGAKHKEAFTLEISLPGFEMIRANYEYH